MIALITPTGGRQDQILLCAEFMRRQTYTGPVLWLIVDDCRPRTTDFIRDNFRDKWVIQKIHPKPIWQPGQNTQGRNIAAAIDVLKVHNEIEAIFIIEDDDYYKPNYLDEMMARFPGYDLIGETHTVYYNLKCKRWIENQNREWSSLFQTAFRPSVIPKLEQLYGNKFIDYDLFRIVNPEKINLFHAGRLSIGMKGQPGRAGIGAGHGMTARMIPDYSGDQLRELIGIDYELYSEYFSFDGVL